tara:strand:+ start:4618 stop:6285 length:1668 start_codon:yes stop_codon:yes gene_type:complete
MTLSFSDFEITDLTQLDSTDVNAMLDRLATQLQELNPDLDLRRGVFKDTLAYYHAILETAIRTNLERYQSARSLQQIEADPTLADDNVVSEVLSNWGVTRKEGTFATGPVTIELSANQSVIIPSGLLFESNGLSFQSTATFTARTEAAQVSNSNDRLLVKLNNGNYAFTVEVQAAEVGSSYKLNAGDLIIPGRAVSSYVTSYATSSFSAGQDTETNAELINELQLGIAAKTLSNRVNMQAWLREYTAYASVTNQAIVGYGDAEMLRDQHTIFPVSYGGRMDWYIRGQQPLQRSAQTISAVLVGIGAGTNTSTWQFSLGKDVFPGFYEIEFIRREADTGLNSGFEIALDSRGNDLTGSGFLPDIATVAEGAYSAFQTTTIRFVDTATPTSGLTVGDTATYVYDITGVPHVSGIQSLVSSRDHRSYAADALVKAPVPCFVQVSFTINKAAGDAEPDISGIKSAVIAVINETGFIGRLDGSRIIDVVHNFIQDDVSVTDLDLFGRIRNPDGSVQYVRDADSLIVPEQPEKMVTANTVQFYSEVSNISINVQSVIPTAT